MLLSLVDVPPIHQCTRSPPHQPLIRLSQKTLDLIHVEARFPQIVRRVDRIDHHDHIRLEEKPAIFGTLILPIIPSFFTSYTTKEAHICARACGNVFKLEAQIVQ